MSGGGRGKTTAAAGAPNIPAAARKVVQSLKEIVNCPESEIYAMLKECNMDPNETVSRLLSQGLRLFLASFWSLMYCIIYIYLGQI